MMIVSKDLAKDIEHVKLNCRMIRLANYMNGEGNPRHSSVKRVLKELTKEEIIQVIFMVTRLKNEKECLKCQNI